MPDIQADLDFLEDLPLYQEEKPYFYMPGKDEDLDPDDERLSNLKFKTYPQITVRDMREEPQLLLSTYGFEFLKYHATAVKAFATESDISAYKAEMNVMLKQRFSAIKVLTYELRLRKNEELRHRELDLSDKLLVEGPAKGAHHDVTYDSFRNILQRHLNPDDQRTYLRPSYRLRIINTWRPLNKVLEDRPLALCDSRTVELDDLIPADRVMPHRTAELYYLRQNPRQQWYWLEKQKSTEPFIFLTYDTLANENCARVCPHVSFQNSRASPGAEVRSSVETRSIVITEVS